VGIITSTYSTVFIASAIAVMLTKGKMGARANAPTSAGPEAVAMSARKKARKAKAS
jgi:hypothetical protein